MSRRRRGRPRKSGPRYPSGKLRPPSPAEIAAGMPHRRDLGCHAVDQLAENELGRMVLRRQIEPFMAMAGDIYARLYRAYLATLDGPRRPYGGSGHGFDCGGCLGMAETRFCRCEARQREWRDAFDKLYRAGHRIAQAVTVVAVYDQSPPPVAIGLLRIGLGVLAAYFGLTDPRKSGSINASSRCMPIIPSTPAG